jgi:hypothetical protein
MDTQPAMAIAGTFRTMNVTGLVADTDYFFGIKISDEVPNVGALATAGPAHTFDIVPPGAVTNFSGVYIGSNTIRLSWNETGDDGSVGTATSREIRYRTDVPLVDANFSSSTLVTASQPAMAVAGTARTMDVVLSPGNNYFFGMKVSD